jgi:hypothetical protein
MNSQKQTLGKPQLSNLHTTNKNRNHIMKKSQVNSEQNKITTTRQQPDSTEQQKKQTVRVDEEKEISQNRKAVTHYLKIRREDYLRIYYEFKKFIIMSNDYDIREGDSVIIRELFDDKWTGEEMLLGVVTHVQYHLNEFDFEGLIVFNW